MDWAPSRWSAGAVVYSRVPSGGGSAAGWQHSARVTQKHRLWPGFYWPRVGPVWWHMIPGGCHYPTGWFGHLNHLQLPWQVPRRRHPRFVTTVGVPPRGVCEARCRSPRHHYCAPAPVQQPPRCSRRPRVLLALPAASPSIGIQTWRNSGGVGERQVRADFMMTLSPNFRPWMGGCYGPSPAADSSREWRYIRYRQVATVLNRTIGPDRSRWVCSIPTCPPSMLQTFSCF
jgi:hypothetical protein